MSGTPRSMDELEAKWASRELVTIGDGREFMADAFAATAGAYRELGPDRPAWLEERESEFGEAWVLRGLAEAERSRWCRGGQLA